MQQQQSSLVQNLYYYIQQRVDSDWSTDPGMAVLLSIVTCGIYGYYIFYKLLERRDLHLARIANMVNTSVALLKEKAAQSGKYALWLVIGLVTGGIGILIGYYFIMDDMARHDQLEAQYFTLMSAALAKMGLSGQASQAAPNIPDRNFVVYLVLSLVTCGIYAFYWLYALVDDGNKHVEAQVPWEDFIYSALAAA